MFTISIGYIARYTYVCGKISDMEVSTECLAMFDKRASIVYFNFFKALESYNLLNSIDFFFFEFIYLFPNYHC